MIDEPIYILGKSNFALSIILDILKLKSFSNQVFIVPNLPASDNSSNDYDFNTDGLNVNQITLREFESRKKGKYILGSIGKGRQQIRDYFASAFGVTNNDYINLIHPSAVVADTSKLGFGIHVSPLSVISPFAELDDFVTINRNVSIGHHTKLKAFACINPGVNIAGICEIGMNTTIGIGATILDKVRIGDNTIIGAASLVTKDVLDNVVAFGIPAKVIKNNS